MTRARVSNRLVVFVLVVVCLDLMTTAVVAFWLIGQQQHVPRAALANSLPCAAIPVRFVHEEPVCADKLLHAMNISNVRITPSDTANRNRTAYK